MSDGRRILVGVMGERLSITSDMTLAHGGSEGTRGTIQADQLKEWIFDEPTGWVEIPTRMEVTRPTEAEWSDAHTEELTGTVRVRNLWVGYVAEEDI